MVWTYAKMLLLLLIISGTCVKLMKDVTPLSLGFEECDGIMDTFITRNTEIPMKMSYSRTTVRDDQTCMLFSVIKIKCF